MSRRPNTNRRPTMGRVEHQMASMYHMIMDEVSGRTGALLDRYHRLHVAPVERRLRWFEEPWYRKLWMRITGTVPDFEALMAQDLEEWDEKFTKPPCGAVHPTTEQACQLDEHPAEVPHRYRRSVEIEGVDPYVEWMEEEGA